MITLTDIELKDFLEEKAELYNQPKFIETDPIQIPREFTRDDDIEISGFLASTIAWGQRPTIIRNAKKLLELMDGSPSDFILNAEEKDFERFHDFKHRTFNGVDCIYFMKSLQNIYRNHGGLKEVFGHEIEQGGGVDCAINYFRKVFFELSYPERTTKHVANISKGAAAKKINMFLRWMVRNDKRGVDFGIWDNISPALLYIPLDVHTGNVGRKLGLLERKQNDWKAVVELTDKLKEFDPNDPVKYDFALFGLGVFEKF